MDLTGNRIDDKAASAFAKVFTSKNETLQVLKVEIPIDSLLFSLNDTVIVS